MKNKITFIILFLPSVLQGQTILDDYIRNGLESNLALNQKLTGYEKSIEALREARSLFYPNISLNARYTRSEGGRVIDIPIGDLLNPVYYTLNSLLSSNIFPMIENQQVPFLRPREHETKIRVTQPVFNTDLYFNSRIKKELSLLEEMDVEQYKRELVAEIKKAYYNFGMANGILSMLTRTRELLLENVRVNRRLIENDKVTPDYLYRSQAELSKFDQDLQTAAKNCKVALAWFNFLLNRPLSDTIIFQEPTVFPAVSQLSGDFALMAIGNREELKKLENYKNISDLQVKMNQSGKLPDLFLVADYGFQGEEYKFNTEQDYLQASAVLTWNLFEGFGNRAKVKQAILQKQIASTKIEEAKKQIELQVLEALNELQVSDKAIVAAENRVKNARESYRLVEKKYSEGMASLIEFIDARTSMTQAEENLIISKYSYLSAYAEFEKVTAINKTQ